MKDIILLPKKDRNKLYYWAEFFKDKEVIMIDFKEPDKTFPWAVFWTGVCLICFSMLVVYYGRGIKEENIQGLKKTTDRIAGKVDKLIGEVDDSFEEIRNLKKEVKSIKLSQINPENNKWGENKASLRRKGGKVERFFKDEGNGLPKR